MLQSDLISIWLIVFQEDLLYAHNAVLENNVHQFQLQLASVKIDLCTSDVLVIRQERRGACLEYVFQDVNCMTVVERVLFDPRCTFCCVFSRESLFSFLYE